jgi:hypothetical protein
MSYSSAAITAFGRTRLRPAWNAFVWRLRQLPLWMRILAGAILILALLPAVNWAYHVLFPASGTVAKTPSQTWRKHGPVFREHSTAVITSELLAALAQADGGGKPVSSKPGMYQITDARFQDAKRYCIRDHVLVQHGPWYDVKSCWFNSLYARVIPSHAVELTAAFLDRGVASTIRRQRIATATLQQKQNLAAVIHLCGTASGDAYARRGFRPTAGQRCGRHDVSSYLAQVNALKQQFVRLGKV